MTTAPSHHSFQAGGGRDAGAVGENGGVMSDLDKLFAEKAAYKRAAKIAMVAMYPIFYLPIAMMLVVFCLMKYVDCPWWIPLVLVLASIAPLPLLQILHTSRCKRAATYFGHRDEYIEQIPSRRRSERVKDARALYGDDWDTALIECEQAHIGGDCPLCGAV